MEILISMAIYADFGSLYVQATEKMYKAIIVVSTSPIPGTKSRIKLRPILKPNIDSYHPLGLRVILFLDQSFDRCS